MNFKKARAIYCMRTYKAVVNAAKEMGQFDLSDLKPCGVRGLKLMEKKAAEHGHVLRVFVFTAVGVVMIRKIHHITGKPLIS